MSFDRVYAYTKKFEGGYANNPNDRGGETFRGIARKIWPSWSGWFRIDTAKKTVGKTAAAINNYFAGDTDMAYMVESFYRDNFWRPVERLNLPSRVAEKMFDVSVNCGLSAAVKMLQRSLNVLVPASKLVIDGKYGRLSAAAIEKVDNEQTILTEMVKQQKAYYQGIIDRDPSQRVFEKGWFNRAAWVPQ